MKPEFHACGNLEGELNLFRIEESSHNGPSIEVAWVFPCFWGREGPLTLIRIAREEKRMPA